MSDEANEIEDVAIENFDVSVRIFAEAVDAHSPPGTLDINVKLFRKYPGKPELDSVSATARIRPDESSGIYDRHATKIQAIAHVIALLYSDLAGDPEIASQPSTYRAASDD